MKSNHRIKTRVDKTTTIIFTRDDIIKYLLRNSDHLPCGIADLLSEVKDGQLNIEFTVPGGGDYSNTDVELNNTDCVIKVSWNIIEETDNES